MSEQPPAFCPHCNGLGHSAHPQLFVMGRCYVTLVGVASRLNALAYADRQHGASDDRATETRLLLEALEGEADAMGAADPQAAVQLAFDNITFINNHHDAPVLTIREELDVAVHNSNQLLASAT